MPVVFEIPELNSKKSDEAGDTQSEGELERQVIVRRAKAAVERWQRTTCGTLDRAVGVCVVEDATIHLGGA